MIDAGKCPKCGGVVLVGRSGAKVCGDDDCDFFFIRAGELVHPDDPAARAVAEYFAAFLEETKKTVGFDFFSRYLFVIESGKVHACLREDSVPYLRELAAKFEGPIT